MCKHCDNQTLTAIQLSLLDYEGLFHLMLQLIVASTTNGIIMVGNHMNKGMSLRALCKKFDNQTMTDI